MIGAIKEANIVDYVVVVAYLMMLSGVGIYLTRFNKTVDDFFKGGGNIPWWISSLSTFVAGFTAFMFVGAAGYTYKHGLASALLFTAAFWAYWLGYFVYAIRWRRSRLSSPMEFLTKRFSQRTTYYYTLLSIVPAIMGLGMGIYILCIFVSTALGIIGWDIQLGFVHLSGLELSMIVTGLVMLIYTSAGGLWAVVITDVLQFIIILIVTLLIFPLAFIGLGGQQGFLHGIDRLITEAPQGFLSLRDAGARPLFYLAYLTSSCIGYNAAWHVGQRYYSVPTERDARKVAVLCAVLSLLLPLLWVAPTMAARLLFPTISQTWPQLSDPSEASFVALALTLLPNGMIGLTISAILAATMTTVDTSLNYLASILVRDVFVRLRTTFGRAALQEKRQLRMSRVTACVLGTLAIATALIVQRTKGVFDFALMYYSWFTPSMLTPVMLGFVYTKTPPWSAGVSATVGLSVVLLSNVVIDVSPYQYEVNIFGGILVSGTVFFLSSFWNRRDRDSRSRLDAFVRDLATPAVSSSFAWDLNALHSYRVVGLLTIAIGGALLAMLFVPAPHDVFVLGLIIGVCTVGLGTLIVLYFRSQMRKLPSHEPRR